MLPARPGADEAVDGEAIDELDLVASCVLLLITGDNTTTHLIGNAILALLRPRPRPPG